MGPNTLLAFYLKESPDCDGRWLEDIWGYPDEDWEFEHGFTQWLFPTAEESLFNPDATVLTDATIKEWHKDKLLQHNLRLSYDRWLRFCGIERVEKALVLTDFKRNVWGRRNHNWWRMTRVLRSLTTLSLAKEAQEFFSLLTSERASGRIAVDDETWSYWSGAVR